MAFQQFTMAGLAPEAQRLEDGAHPILNPDRLRLENPVIVILAQLVNQRLLQRPTQAIALTIGAGFRPSRPDERLSTFPKA